MIVGFPASGAGNPTVIRRKWPSTGVERPGVPAPGWGNAAPVILPDPALLAVLRRQSGVIARRQVLAAGASDNDIERWVRRHEWAPVHRGVFVDHTGPPTWDQRAWAAVLAFAPAALSGESALRAHGVRAAQGRERGRAQLDATPVSVPIEICVDETRSLLAVPGVRLERVTGFERLGDDASEPAPDPGRACASQGRVTAGRGGCGGVAR